MTLIDDINAYLGTSYATYEDVPGDEIWLLLLALLAALRILEER